MATFDLEDYITDKSTDFLNLVILDDNVECNFIECMDNYLTEKYDVENVDLDLDFRWNPDKDIPIFYVDESDLNTTDTKAAIKDIENKIKYWINTTKAVYNAFNESFSKIYRKYPYIRGNLYYTDFYSQKMKFGNKIELEEKTIDIENSNLTSKPTDKFNRIRLDFHLIIKTYRVKDFNSSLANRCQLTSKYIPRDKNNYENLARNIYANKIKDKLQKELNIENTNIRNYSVMLYVHHLNEDEVNFTVILEILYKGNFNKKYLYLDKLAESMIELVYLIHN